MLQREGYVSELSGSAGGWIAYLLHQWFSSRRGECGVQTQDPRERRLSQLFGEQLLGFYKVALRICVAVMGNRKEDATKIYFHMQKSV